MILIYVKNSGKVYEFPTVKTASIWVKNYPEMYEEDLNNIQLYSDKKFANTLQINAADAIEETINCQGCGVGLKFTVEATDVVFTVLCPQCKTRHTYQP